MRKIKSVGDSGPAIQIDHVRAEEAVLKVYLAAIHGKGIFRGGPNEWRKRFLPQWNFPAEIEYDPLREQPKDLDSAGKILFTRNNMDRLQVSSFLQAKLLSAWADAGKRWIFYPKEVVRRTEAEVELFLKEHFHYAIPVKVDQLTKKVEISAGKGYRQNMVTLLEEYDSDSRNLINGVSIEEARKRIRKMKGFASGLANLLIIEMADREIAYPTDPENLLFKIDRHKARFLFNVGAAKVKKDSTGVHANSVIQPFEQEYWRICKKYSLDPKLADAAIWVVGSVGCVRANYHLCHSIQCSLLDICYTNTELNMESGRFLVGKDGVGINRNRNAGQAHLNFYRDDGIVHEENFIKALTRNNGKEAPKNVSYPNGKDSEPGLL